MHERLLFLPVVVIVVALGDLLGLSSYGFAVLCGLAILAFESVRAPHNAFDPVLGYWAVAIGMACLLIAYAICVQQGIALAWLEHDSTLPRFIRRLPFLGITFMSLGAGILALRLVRKD